MKGWLHPAGLEDFVWEHILKRQCQEYLTNLCLLIVLFFLDEPHKAGDIIEDRIILTDNVWHGENIPTEEELDSVVYDKGYAVRAIKINLIDDIETRTDMTPYGFTKVDENRYCKTNEAIGWARMECYVNRLPKHKPTEEEMEFWME